MRILKDGIDITNDGNFTVEISDYELRDALSTYKHINDLKFILCGSPFYNEIFNEIDKLDMYKKLVDVYRKERKCNKCRIAKDLTELDNHNQMLLDYIKKTQGIKDIHKWYIELTRKE